MKSKISVLFCILILLNSFCFLKPIKKSAFEFVNFNSKIVHKNGPAVLILRFHLTESGVQHHVLNLYKGLLNKGFNIHLAVAHGTTLQKRLADEELSHYSISCIGKKSEKDKFNLFYSAINQICKEQKIDVIHTNGAIFEFDIAKKVAKALNIKVVQQHHSYVVPDVKCYRGSDALILASPHVSEILNKHVNQENNVKCVRFMPPLCDADKFLNFVPFGSKELFFKSAFGISLLGFPILLMIANFNKCKNHDGLLHALHNLIYKDNFPVECFLAGADFKSGESILKKLCSELGLDRFVHFLGFVTDTPSLLFHSDIVILPSNGDAFPIAILEAAFMRKAIILSQNAGSAGLVIKDNQTGLLCDPKLPKNIALKIREMVQSPELREKFGFAAFEHVSKNFSQESVLDLYIDFYKHL